MSLSPQKTTQNPAPPSRNWSQIFAYEHVKHQNNLIFNSLCIRISIFLKIVLEKMKGFRDDLMYVLGRENCRKMPWLFPHLSSNQENGTEVPIVAANDVAINPEVNVGIASKLIAIILANVATRKQFEIWKGGLERLGARVCSSFGEISSDKVDIFIIPPKMDGNKFIAWTNLPQIPKPESGVFITTTQFAIDSLDQNRLMIPAEYLHDIQQEPSAESSSSTTSSNKKDSDFQNLEPGPRIPIILPSSTLNHNKSNSSSNSSSAIVTYSVEDIIIPGMLSTSRILPSSSTSPLLPLHITLITSCSLFLDITLVLSVNLNEHITPFLTRLAEYYATHKSAQQMDFRKLSFVRCVSVLTSYHKKVETLADLKVNGHYLKFFGNSMRTIIKEESKVTPT